MRDKEEVLGAMKVPTERTWASLRDQKALLRNCWLSWNLKEDTERIRLIGQCGRKGCSRSQILVAGERPCDGSGRTTETPTQPGGREGGTPVGAEAGQTWTTRTLQTHRWIWVGLLGETGLLCEYFKGKADVIRSCWLYYGPFIFFFFWNSFIER